MERQCPVCAMRPVAGEPCFAVTLSRCRQLIFQSVLHIPPRVIFDMDLSQLGNQGSGLAGDETFQSHKAARSQQVNLPRRSAQVIFPRSKKVGGCTLPKQGVTLTQSSAPRFPQLQRRVFHVEHTPIQERPSFLGWTENQGLALGAEINHGASFEQWRQIGQIFTIEAADPAVILSRQAKSHFRLARSPGFSIDEIFTCPLALRSGPTAGPEGTPVGKNVSSLEHRRFAGAIWSNQPIDSGAGLKAHVLEATQIVRTQQLNIHGLTLCLRPSGYLTTATASPHAGLPDWRRREADNWIGRHATAAAPWLRPRPRAHPADSRR